MDRTPERPRAGHLPARPRRAPLGRRTPAARPSKPPRSTHLRPRKKQNLGRATRKARQEPVVRALLDDAFARLALADPEGHFRAAIARYGLDVVVDAIATFEAKKKVGTLLAGVDARYLLGSARNLADEREGLAIADEMLRARLDARDRLLAPLVRARDAARADVADARDRLLRFVDLALTAERGVDRSFWLLTAAEEINACSQPRARPRPA